MVLSPVPTAGRAATALMLEANDRSATARHIFHLLVGDFLTLLVVVLLLVVGYVRPLSWVSGYAKHTTDSSASN